MAARRKALLAWVAAVAGSLLVLSLFNTAGAKIEAFQVSLHLGLFQPGTSELLVPPIGSVTAATHQVPVRLQVSLTGIDLTALREFLAQTATQPELLLALKERVMVIMRWYLLHLLILAALGGALGTIALRELRPWAYLRGALIGVLAFVLLLGAVALDYDATALSRPHYTGVLAAAPWMVGLAQEALARVDRLGNDLQVAVDNLETFVDSADQLPNFRPQDSEVRLLHVSDIHNNPAAFDFVEQVVKGFGVDLVVDTGDISDYGTPLEANLVKRIEAVRIPYLFVPGNHDAPEIVAAIKKLSNAVVLDEQVERVRGLRIFGAPDPASREATLRAMTQEDAAVEADRLRGVIKAEGGADLVAVHSHNLGARLAGSAPVVLFGHDHRQRVEQANGSLLIDAGTTGAAGVRGLQRREGVPYTVTLLYFGRDEAGRLRLNMVDSLSLYDLGGSLTLNRMQISNPGSQQAKDKGQGQDEARQEIDPGGRSTK